MKSIKWALIFFCFISGQTMSLSAYSQNTIPGASKQPKWVFPIYFEEGGGQKDTIYFGYDPDATHFVVGLDAIFGEKWITPDSAEFHAYVSIWSQPDSIIKVDIQHTVFAFDIAFINGEFPLIMTWDPLLFYSDSLPFPNLSPNPTARGELWCSDPNPNYPNCPVGVPIYMTDMPTIYFLFVAEDSIFFSGDSSTPIMFMGVILNPWDKPLGFSDPPFSYIDFSIFPNPASKSLTITTSSKILYSIELFDILGRLALNTRGKHSGTSKISVEELPDGIYLLKVKSKKNNQYVLKKIIVSR